MNEQTKNKKIPPPFKKCLNYLFQKINVLLHDLSIKINQNLHSYSYELYTMIYGIRFSTNIQIIYV